MRRNKKHCYLGLSWWVGALLSDGSPVRVGFWPRGIALFVDGCLITLILGTLGVLLFAPTSGRIRVDRVLIGSQTCFPKSLQAPQELKISIPSNFHPTHVARCEKTVLGHLHDNRLVVAEITRSGGSTYTRELNFPLDTTGQPVHAFYLDSLASLLFLLYVLVTEGRTGRTLGKDLMGIRVESLSGGQPSFLQAFRRLIRFIPIILLETLSVASMAGLTIADERALFWSVCASLAGSAVILTNFIVAVRRDTLPWHDRFGSTQVVDGR